MKTTLSPSDAGNTLLKRTMQRRSALKKGAFNGIEELAKFDRALWLETRVIIIEFYNNMDHKEVDSAFKKSFNIA